MARVFLTCVLGCLLMACFSLGHRMPNFISQDDLSDGQHEIRIHFNGVNAKQTSVGHDQGSESGLVLRQISHHRHLLTLIYVGEVSDRISVEGLSLRDCELTSEKEEVDTFIRSFKEDADLAKDTPSGSWSGPLQNVSFVHLSEEAELPEYLRPVVHFRQLRAQCKDHHRRVRAGVKAERRSHKSHNLGSATEDENSNLGVSHARSRRSVLDSLRFPATKWCGVGYSASVYGELGGESSTDMCCRQHDLHCPYYVTSFEKKYGIVNWSIGTINHCACDERFRACLRKSKTGASNMVGTVFFDVVKTRCFVFKMEKTCKKWSWWGRCEKYGMEKVASLRDPIPWSS
ncbi:uncharacterized protein LOC122247463 isoform X1 [Penaeus japonicus]|uniref:uncharacterized protein LOC122247463 isoform X1 n=1 Tax=Penaeus japonicus TaxID=27405 RepID=UPI001C70C6F2|nr:uncharacterized protein LOC122247463 isoform X1 [Penaeus japonicus]